MKAINKGKVTYIILSIAMGIGLLYVINELLPITANAQGSSSPTGKVVELTQEEFIEKVFDFKRDREWIYKGDKPAIIDFYAVWCGPCKRLKPRLEQLASEYGDEIIIYSIDAEQALELSRFMQIRAFPTLLFIPTKGKPTMAEGLLSLKVLRQQADIIKNQSSGE